LGSICVASITGLTASCSFPPGVVNSFWYSMKSSAVFELTTSQPPLAAAAGKARSER